MALQFPPKKQAVYMCDFKGLVPPEMVKVRPVVVVSASKARPGLATVIPLSTTPPVPMHRWHVRLPRRSSWDRQERWAKCDMIYQVSLRRLTQIGQGRDLHGKRKYLTFKVHLEDFQAIKIAILHGIGLHEFCPDGTE